MSELRFKKLHKDAKLPYYINENSSLITFTSPDTIYLRYGSIDKLKIGVEPSIPDGYELELRPLPELGLKGATMVNSPLTVTSGELVVALTTLSLEPVYISRGDPVVLGVLRPITRLPINPPRPEQKSDSIPS